MSHLSRHVLTVVALTALVFGVAVVWSSAAAQGAADLERQARELFDQERYREAADLLQKLLATDPGNRTGNVLLSFALARQDLPDRRTRLDDPP